MAKKVSGRTRIEADAEKLAAPIAEKHGVYIYDVDYVKEGPEYYLNIYIDKEGGVGILDCEAVSRELSDRLDERLRKPAAKNLKASCFPGTRKRLPSRWNL